MKQEDIDFLKDLQHELKNQETDCQEEPRYWTIMEKKEVAVPDRAGEEYRICNGSDNAYTIEEIKEIIEENIKSETEDRQKEWNETDHSDANAITDFLNEKEGSRWHLVSISTEDVPCLSTGAFLTKRAAQEYIRRFGYNHSKPRTYARTAYRNFELEQLLNILKTMDIDELKPEQTSNNTDDIISIPTMENSGWKKDELDAKYSTDSWDKSFDINGKTFHCTLRQESNTVGRNWFVHVDNDCFDSVGTMDVARFSQIYRFLQMLCD